MSVLLGVVIAMGAHGQTTLNWFTANFGKASPVVEDDVSGAPTETLLYVPTSVTFSRVYFNVTTADTATGDYYDLGIGRCPSLDCSQPRVTITILCSIGSSGSGGTGVNLASTGPQSFPCTQTTPITIQPGVYVLLGGGNAKVAHCAGQNGSAPPIPFKAAGSGTATDGSLTNPNSTIFKTDVAGSRSAGNACMISLH
jgi:hypothetical protein